MADGSNDFNELALWTSAHLAGMVTGMLTARRPFFRKLMRRLYPSPDSPVGAAMAAAGLTATGRRTHRPPRNQAFPMLAEAVIGSSKETIASVFGPPRGAVLAGIKTSGATTFWQADTWYYALPRISPMAIAIMFEKELARTVDFFSPPSPR